MCICLYLSVLQVLLMDLAKHASAEVHVHANRHARVHACMGHWYSRCSMQDKDENSMRMCVHLSVLLART